MKKRLTVDTWLQFCDIAQCAEQRYGIHCPDGFCDQRRCYEKLREYERAEQDGRIIVLPVEIGGEIYMVTQRRYSVSYPYNPFVRKTKVTWLNIERVIKEFGISIFATKEEADCALEKLLKENGNPNGQN